MLRALSLALATALWAAAAVAQDALPPAVLRALKAAGVPPDAMAAVALPLGHHAPPWRHRADVPMQPGSAMKLVTAVVALDRLGITQRGSTELRSAAPLAGGVLQGDLVLKGGADPDLGLPQFWAMLLELREQGITEIAGDLVIDRTLFRPTRPDLGLPPFDDSPEAAYNVVPDALMLAGNLLPLELRGDADGVHVAAMPALQGLELASGMTLSARPCRDWEEDWLPAQVQHPDGRTRVTLQGAFPAGCTQRTALQLIDRDELAARLFRTLWQGLGGRWAGQVREAAAPPEARLLARRVGRPLGELLRPVLKTSDNALTRLIYLTLGVAAMDAEPQAGTAELAAREVRRWFAEHGIDDRGLVLDNGSGLSRSERITPWQMAQLLQVAWNGPLAADLLAGLPLAGIDGTMRNRLKDSPAAGWARLKTGTLRNVVALAGVVRDPRGRPWAVAMMINHEQAAGARPALDALVDSFARVGPRRAPAPRRHGR
jgi:D-alanyl-D-alanine carboxypeptidase/D-alanyl-D-alanine-endopeptidase (penicillin-binding protein 4)